MGNAVTTQHALEKLEPELRAKVAQAAYSNELYGERYTVAPAIAIQWFLSRRRPLFPRCKLTPTHLAIAQATKTPSSLSLLDTTAEETPFPVGPGAARAPRATPE